MLTYNFKVIVHSDIQELLDAAKEMVEAYTPSYDNKWQSTDGWGRGSRRSWEEDARVRNRLKDAVEKFDKFKEPNVSKAGETER